MYPSKNIWAKSPKNYRIIVKKSKFDRNHAQIVEFHWKRSKIDRKLAEILFFSINRPTIGQEKLLHYFGLKFF